MAAQLPEFSQVKQYKQFIGTYNKLTESWYLDCVKTSKQENLMRPPVQNIVCRSIFK